MLGKQMHSCKEIEALNQSSSTSAVLQVFSKHWVLHYFSFADDKCVEDGEAQYEGEIIIIVDIQVTYCPYCGLSLMDNAKPNDAKQAEPKKETRHLCPQLERYNKRNPKVGYSFDADAYWVIERYDDWWNLARYTKSTERMIANDEAEKDEMMFWNSTGISFCPFCGDRL
jgi:hypothetical protein